MRNLVTALVFGLLSLTAARAHASSIVTNGGFETGNFSGWTTTNAPSGSDYGVSGSANTGTYAASFGGVTTGSYDSISQTLSTVSGATYNLSFYLATYGGSDSDFQALWDGAVIYDTLNPVDSSYSNVNLNLFAQGSDTLTFRGYNVPSFDYLDDVSVTQTAVTPEPSSLALLGTGLLGATGILRRRFLA